MYIYLPDAECLMKRHAAAAAPKRKRSNRGRGENPDAIQNRPSLVSLNEQKGKKDQMKRKKKVRERSSKCLLALCKTENEKGRMNFFFCWFWFL